MTTDPIYCQSLALNRAIVETIVIEEDPSVDDLKRAFEDASFQPDDLKLDLSGAEINIAFKEDLPQKDEDRNFSLHVTASEDRLSARFSVFADDGKVWVDFAATHEEIISFVHNFKPCPFVDRLGLSQPPIVTFLSKNDIYLEAAWEDMKRVNNWIFSAIITSAIGNRQPAFNSDIMAPTSIH